MSKEVKIHLKKNVSLLLTLLGRIFTQNGIPVLLYHSIDASGSVISTSPGLFNAQMEYLSRYGYQTLRLIEYINFLTQNTISKQKRILITFDDGFGNNYSEVLPILNKYGFTAAIFLPTYYIGKKCTWEKHRSIPELRMLTWDQILEMNENGVEFGSHSHSHPYLSRLSEGQIINELLMSKSLLESRLSKPVEFFCHPYGDSNPVTRKLAAESGYVGAFSGVDFNLSGKPSDIYDLKRLGTSHFNSLQDFKAGLAGTYQWYISLKRLFGKHAV